MSYYQLSMEDIENQKILQAVSDRTAYIDEYGSFGFDFSSTGASKYYILCAVIVENKDIDKLHSAVAEVKKNNGFDKAELKSSKIGNDYKRRNRILSQLLMINFRVILFIADKQAFIQGSPLTEYKKSFIKFLHQRLYNLLYHVYPKLKIIEDEIGTTEFQASFREYVQNSADAIDDAEKCGILKNGEGDVLIVPFGHSENFTPAAPASPVDAGAAARSPSAVEPASLAADECTENPTSSAAATAAAEETVAAPEPSDSASMTAAPVAKSSEPAGVAPENILGGADGSTAFDYSGLDDQTVADDVCPYLELIENSKKYSCQCSICGDRFVNTEICNKTFLSCGWYLDQQDKDALNHSEENTDKDNCLCRTCGSEECPGRGCNKECPNGSDGSCFTATCPGYIERTDIICKDKATNAPSVDAAATSDESAARMCEGPDEETQTTPAAASGAALESLHAQSALPQNAPAQDIAADAPSALGFDFGADESTNAELLQCAQTFVIGKVAQVMAAKRAHDLTANNKNGAFGKWCAAVGISRDKGNQLVNIADNFGNIELEGKPIIEVTPISLLALGAKPSTPDVLTEGIGRGEITTIKQFRELEAQLKAVQTERDEARKAKEKAEQERDAARDAQAASSRLTNMITNQRDEAQIRAEKAELRAQTAEEDAAGWKKAGLEMQELVDQLDERIRELESGITVEAAAVDQEEIERRANELSEPLVKIINQQNEEIQQLAAGNTVSAQASVLEHYLKTMEASLLSNAQRAELASYDIGALDSLARALREFADSIDGIFEDRSEDND